MKFNVPRTDAALNDDYYATYQITLDNDSVFDYTFLAGDFQPSLTTLNEGDIETSFSLDVIQLGEVIPAKGSKTFNLTIHMVPNNAGNYNVSGEVEIEVEPEIEVGSVIGSIPRNSTGDLINNNMVPVTATIINSYEETKTYNIVVTNNSFELVDVNGSPLNTYSIGANTELQETVYIRIKRYL